MTETHEPARQIGRVRHWVDARGFGFLAIPGDRDIYLHVTRCEDERAPREGWRMEFQLATDERGRRLALNARRVVDEDSQPPVPRHITPWWEGD